MVERVTKLKTPEECAVFEKNRDAETMGYTALLEMGLEDYAFEAVVVLHPGLFSPEAVRHSRDRIKAWKKHPYRRGQPGAAR